LPTLSSAGAKSIFFFSSFFFLFFFVFGFLFPNMGWFYLLNESLLESLLIFMIPPHFLPSFSPLSFSPAR